MTDVRSVVIRAAAAMDFETICGLNLADVQNTSAMDRARLVKLDSLSCYHQVAILDGAVAAFLLAMCSGSSYENENFEWFSRRYPRFIYVDRIVVSSTARGMGLATRMYDDMFRHACAQAIPIVACEYNILPLNEPSRRFHDKLGFKEQATQWVGDGSKRVSLQVAETVRLSR